MGLSKADEKAPGPSSYKPELAGAVYLSTDSGGALKECFSINDNPERSVASMIEELCDSFDGTYDKATNKCKAGSTASAGGSLKCKGAPPIRPERTQYCFCTTSGWRCPSTWR